MTGQAGWLESLILAGDSALYYEIPTEAEQALDPLLFSDTEGLVPCTQYGDQVRSIRAKGGHGPLLVEVSGSTVTWTEHPSGRAGLTTSLHIHFASGIERFGRTGFFADSNEKFAVSIAGRTEAFFLTRSLSDYLNESGLLLAQTNDMLAIVPRGAINNIFGPKSNTPGLADILIANWTGSEMQGWGYSSDGNVYPDVATVGSNSEPIGATIQIGGYGEDDNMTPGHLKEFFGLFALDRDISENERELIAEHWLVRTGRQEAPPVDATPREDALWVETFDQSPPANTSPTPSTDGWYDNVNFRLNTTEQLDGDGCYEYFFPEGSDEAPDGGGMRRLLPASDEVDIEFRIKVSPTWNDGECHLFYIVTDSNGPWTGLSSTFLTLYVELLGSEIVVYAQDYLAAHGGNWRTLGISNGANVTDGRWHKVRARFKLNTWTGGLPNADGVVQLWVDDLLHVNNGSEAIQRHTPVAKLNQIVLGPYLNVNTPAIEDMSLYVDNLDVIVKNREAPPQSGGRYDPQYDPPAHLQWFYVDAQNGDDNNDGSAQNPWQTLAYAVQQLQAGQGLRLRPGVYLANQDNSGWPSIQPLVSGTEENPIVIMKDPAADSMPIITRTQSVDGALIGASHTNHLHLIELEVDANLLAVNAIRFSSATGCRVIRCKVHRAYNAHEFDNCACIRLETCTDTLIIGNDLYDSYNAGQSENSSGVMQYNSKNTEIAFNDIYDTVSAIRDKTFVNQNPNLPAGVGSGGLHVHHNYLHDVHGAGVSIYCQNGGDAIDISIHHNVIIALRGVDFPGLDNDPQHDGVYGAQIFNNTIVEYGGELTETCALFIPPFGSGVEFFNNICVPLDVTDYDVIGRASFDALQSLDHNAFRYTGRAIEYLWSVTGPERRFTISTDPDPRFAGNLYSTAPGFVDDSVRDYRLSVGSDMVGAGRNGETIGALDVESEPTWMWWVEGVEPVQPGEPVSPGKVLFVQPDSSVPHNAGIVQIPVTRADGKSGPASVDWVTDEDPSRGGTLNWAEDEDGIEYINLDLSSYFNTPVDVVIVISLVNAQGASLGAQTTHTLTVQAAEEEHPGVLNQLFKPGDAGAYYEIPTEEEQAAHPVLFSDQAGTIPCVEYGEQVRAIRDISGFGPTLVHTTGSAWLWQPDANGRPRIVTDNPTEGQIVASFGVERIGRTGLMPVAGEQFFIIASGRTDGNFVSRGPNASAGASLSLGQANGVLQLYARGAGRASYGRCANDVVGEVSTLSARWDGMNLWGRGINPEGGVVDATQPVGELAEPEGYDIVLGGANNGNQFLALREFYGLFLIDRDLTPSEQELVYDHFDYLTGVTSRRNLPGSNAKLGLQLRGIDDETGYTAYSDPIPPHDLVVQASPAYPAAIGGFAFGFVGGVPQYRWYWAQPDVPIPFDELRANWVNFGDTSEELHILLPASDTTWTIDLAFGDIFDDQYSQLLRLTDAADNVLVEYDQSPEAGHAIDAAGNSVPVNDWNNQKQTRQLYIPGNLLKVKLGRPGVDSHSSLRYIRVFGEEQMTLEGKLSSQSRVIGGMNLRQALTGVIRSKSTLYGDITDPSVRLMGAVQASSQLTGSLSMAQRMSGAVSGTSNLSGDLTVRVGAITGKLRAESNLSGSLVLKLRMRGRTRSDLRLRGSLTGIYSPASLLYHKVSVRPSLDAFVTFNRYP